MYGILSSKKHHFKTKIQIPICFCNVNQNRTKREKLPAKLFVMPHLKN